MIKEIHSDYRTLIGQIEEGDFTPEGGFTLTIVAAMEEFARNEPDAGVTVSVDWPRFLAHAADRAREARRRWVFHD